MNQHRPNPIRSVIPDDLPELKRIIDATDMFPSEMLDDMIAGFFNEEGSDEIWLTHDRDGAKAIAYCRSEEMTDRTWNLLLIASIRTFRAKALALL